MADQIDVVIEVAYEVLTDVLSCPPGVSDKFSLGHLVLHVRTGEINGKKDEGVAQNIHCIRTKTHVLHHSGVAGTKAMGELGY